MNDDQEAADILIRLVGIKEPPREPTVIGVVVRVVGDDPFEMVGQACTVAEGLIPHLPCQTVRTEFVPADDWDAEPTEPDEERE